MDWSGLPQTSWCTTRRCEGSAAEVAALLQGYAVGSTRLTVDGAVLAFGSSAPPVPGLAAVAPPRTRDARLRYARWRPAARVTVEVEPWSTDRSEIAIRPARRLPPGADAYFAAATALLGALVLDLGLDRLRGSAGAAVPADPLRRAS